MQTQYKSSEHKLAGIIGKGLIGSHLAGRIKQELDLEILFSFGKSGITPQTLKNISPMRPDIIFLAIPTLDTGEMARDYILECMRLGIFVVICEKGSLSYHAETLMRYVNIGRIGFDAACGGGSRILSEAQRYALYALQVEIEAVLNSTLNFSAGLLEQGKTKEEVHDTAKKEGIAEPGSESFYYMIKGEMRDLVMKTCVFYNTVLAGAKYITPRMFGAVDPTAADIEDWVKLFRLGYRAVVSFDKTSARYHSKLRPHHSELRPPLFAITIGDCVIRIGLRNVAMANDDIRSWFPQGIENGIRVLEKGNVLLERKGFGAKPGPTTDSMIANARTLLARSERERQIA